MPCPKASAALVRAAVLCGVLIRSHGVARRECWLDGYTPDVCCDTVTYGPRGHPSCFTEATDGFLSFEECCVTQASEAGRRRALLAEAAGLAERGLLEAAAAPLRAALALEPEGHDAHFDLALLRARLLDRGRAGAGDPQHGDLVDAGRLADAPCAVTSSPLARVLVGVAPWRGAERHVPRLLCLAYTAGRHGAARVAVQWQLWGWRCDHFVAVGDQQAASAVRDLFGDAFPVLLWPGGEGRNQIWKKIQFVWRAVAAAAPPLPSDFEWAFLAGDDVFVVVENLRRRLLAEAGSQDGAQDAPLYVGHPLRLADLDFEFNAGGPGYALNRAAVRALARSLGGGGVVSSDPLCGQPRETSAEDLMVAFCLRRQGVLPSSPAPGAGAFAFLPFGLHHFLLDLSRGLDPVEGYLSYHFNSWVQQINGTPQWTAGERCCSPHAVAFHEMTPYLSLRLTALLYACGEGEEDGAAQVRGLLRRLRPLGLTVASDLGWQRTGQGPPNASQGGRQLDAGWAS